MGKKPGKVLVTLLGVDKVRRGWEILSTPLFSFWGMKGFSFIFISIFDLMWCPSVFDSTMGILFFQSVSNMARNGGGCFIIIHQEKGRLARFPRFDDSIPASTIHRETLDEIKAHQSLTTDVERRWANITTAPTKVL